MPHGEVIRSVLLVDDHPVFVEGIRQLCSVKYKILSAFDSHQALDTIYRHPELSLVLLDRTLPDIDGLQLLSILKRRYPEIPVTVMSADENIATIRLALELGAAGYIPKTIPPEQLSQAVDDLIDGEDWIPDEIHGLLDIEQHPKKNRHGMTSRQYTVLRLLEAGFDNKGIAESLGISESTVKTHVSALFRAMGARNRTACVRTARQLCLLE